MELYRSYNDKLDITDHFYTTDRLEHHIMASQGYVMQRSFNYKTWAKNSPIIV